VPAVVDGVKLLPAASLPASVAAGITGVGIKAGTTTPQGSPRPKPLPPLPPLPQQSPARPAVTASTASPADTPKPVSAPVAPALPAATFYREPNSVSTFAQCHHCSYQMSGEEIMAGWWTNAKDCICLVCGSVVKAELAVELPVGKDDIVLGAPTSSGAAGSTMAAVPLRAGSMITIRVPMMEPARLLEAYRSSVDILPSELSLDQVSDGLLPDYDYAS